MEMRTNDKTGHALLPALVTGTVASLASAAALAMLARVEGKGALQPINATSHWLHGKKAAQCDELDATHTLVGFATHFASGERAAAQSACARAGRQPASAKSLLRGACPTSAVAAVIDYGVTPKRFTPGWELVLSKRSMVVAYAALALGLASGGKVVRSLTAVPGRPAKKRNGLAHPPR